MNSEKEKAELIYDTVWSYLDTYVKRKIIDSVSVALCTDYSFDSFYDDDQEWVVTISEWDPSDFDLAYDITKFVEDKIGEKIDVRFEW